METMYFILGMLSIVGAAFVATTVWGIVKIVKLSKQNKNHEEYMNSMERQYHTRIDEMYRDLDTRFNDVYQSSEHVQRSINDQITDSVTQSKSYTDSRIDKLIDTYFEMKGITSKKQVIKG